MNLTDAAIRKALYRESVWLPWAIASGCGLHPSNVLRYVVAVDRADNTTRQFQWNAKSISARCGVTSATNDASLLPTYKAAGLIEIYERATRGLPYTVTVAKVPTKQRLVLPLAACWTHRWRNGAPASLRYGKDTAQVLRVLLVEMRVGEWGDDRLTVTSELSIPEKARRAGLPVSQYERAWAVVRKRCTPENTPWLSWERLQRPDTGLDVYRVHIDWRHIPALLAAVTPTTETGVPVPAESGVPAVESDPVSAVGGDPVSAAESDPLSVVGVTQFVPELSKETSPLSSVLCSSVLPSQSSPAPAEPKRANLRLVTNTSRGGMDEKVEASTTSSLDDLDQALRATKPATAADDTDDHTTATYDAWLLAVIAGIVSPANPGRLDLRRTDVDTLLHDDLTAAYDHGWQPDALIRAVTSDSNDGVQRPAGILRHRLRNLPPVVNAPAPLHHHAATEEAVHQAAAAARHASHFTQRTM